jgi:hypothetical protein
MRLSSKYHLTAFLAVFAVLVFVIETDSIKLVLFLCFIWAVCGHYNAKMKEEEKEDK